MDKRTKMNSENNTKLICACGKCQEERKEPFPFHGNHIPSNHEKEGCGKDIPTGVPPNIWSCTRPCGSDPKQLCSECSKENHSPQVTDDKPLSEMRKVILEKVLNRFSDDFISPLKNAKQISDETDLIDFIIREVKTQDKKISDFVEELEDEINEIERGNIFEEWLECKNKRANLHKYFCKKMKEKIEKAREKHIGELG